jgi:hypothetical protein
MGFYGLSKRIKSKTGKVVRENKLLYKRFLLDIHTLKPYN